MPRKMKKVRPPPAHFEERAPYEELDLHGLTVEQAIPRVDEFLHQTYRSGRHTVYIVHGKGSGTLRQETSRYLGRHPLVQSFALADQGHGGFGVTEVRLSDH
jgi:dsDNA-specific endonuclease/ATPase MutS2